VTISGLKAWLVLVVLILSLCLNSFFVGAILIHQRGGGPDGPGGRGAGQELAEIAGFERLLRGLPEDTREHVRTAFDAHAGQIRPAFRDLREARRGALEALAGEPFDPARLEAAFAGVRDRTMTLQQLLHGIFLDVAAGMPDGMREDMVDRWRDRR